MDIPHYIRPIAIHLIEWLKRYPSLDHPAGGFPGFSFTADDYPSRDLTALSVLCIRLRCVDVLHCSLYAILPVLNGRRQGS